MSNEETELVRLFKMYQSAFIKFGGDAHNMGRMEACKALAENLHWDSAMAEIKQAIAERYSEMERLCR